MSREKIVKHYNSNILYSITYELILIYKINIQLYNNIFF